MSQTFQPELCSTIFSSVGIPPNRLTAGDYKKVGENLTFFYKAHPEKDSIVPALAADTGLSESAIRHIIFGRVYAVDSILPHIMAKLQVNPLAIVGLDYRTGPYKEVFQQGLFTTSANVEIVSKVLSENYPGRFVGDQFTDIVYVSAELLGMVGNLSKPASKADTEAAIRDVLLAETLK
jgi:hypothetical protein